MALTRTARWVAVLVGGALLAAGCGGGSGGSSTLASGSGALKGASFTVGGKEFTEQKILCEITGQALQAAGATVKRQCGLSGSATVRTALLSGRIDMYWEYTGTGWITFLKHTTPIHDPQQQYDAVAKQDLSQNKIHWLPYANFDNTYAIAVKNDTLPNVKTLSDYGALARATPQQASTCVATEFVNRDDGLPGLEKTYGFKLAGNQLATLDAGAIYNAIAKKNPCTFGEVFTTDGRIQGLGLRVLQDDKRFFPVYNPSLTVRQSVLDQYPKLADVIAPIARALDTTTMQKLNASVDVQGDTPAQAATNFLKDKGIVK